MSEKTNKLIEQENRKGFFGKLRNYFSIMVKKPQFSTTAITVPAAVINGKAKVVKLPSDLELLWKWWLTEASDDAETLKNRTDRYDDLSYMYYNNTVMSMATELYADETVQADSQSQVLQITAKKTKVKKYIEDFFDKIGITQPMLKATAFDLALYADHFWVNTSNQKEGITEIIPLDVYTVKDRIEFNALEATKRMDKKQRLYTQLINKHDKLQKLAKVLNDTKTDYASYFRKYLFGFQMEKDIFLPPWNISHFRRFSSQSEFYPFGRPLFINCISPFRQLQTSKNLVAMARVAKFPKEHFEVEVSDRMTEVEKWNATNQAREEYDNLGTNQTGKEEFGVGGKIWTPKGLLDYKLIENRMKVEDINDLEMLRDDMILGTRVPKGYLIVDRASFGTSGQALLQQFKPFGRAVFSLQSCILNELINLVKLQFVMTDDYEVDEPFEISMNFPVIEESSDRLRVKSDTLRLANDIITNLQNALGLGRGEAIPPEVVKDVFSKISFIDVEDIEDWIDAIKPEEDVEIKESIKKKIKNRLTEELIKEIEFKTKKDNRMFEGVSSGRHFCNSFKVDKMQKTILDLFKNDSGKLKG